MNMCRKIVRVLKITNKMKSESRLIHGYKIFATLGLSGKKSPWRKKDIDAIEEHDFFLNEHEKAKIPWHFFWWNACQQKKKKLDIALIKDNWSKWRKFVKYAMQRQRKFGAIHNLWICLSNLSRVRLTVVRFIYYECDATFHVLRFGNVWQQWQPIRYNFNHWCCCINMQMNIHTYSLLSTSECMRKAKHIHSNVVFLLLLWNASGAETIVVTVLWMVYALVSQKKAF